MIRIEKNPAPARLASKAKDWTTQALSTTPGPERQSLIRKLLNSDKSIKAALLREAAEKCAYCESTMRHVSPGDLEHIIPSSNRPELAFEWKNMILCCYWCNTWKGNYYKEELLLVDPTRDDPNEHLIFCCLHLLGKTDRGAKTCEQLQLNRNELLQTRKERVDRLMPLIQMIIREENVERKALLVSELRNETSKTNPHSKIAYEHSLPFTMASSGGSS